MAAPVRIVARVSAILTKDAPIPLLRGSISHVSIHNNVYKCQRSALQVLPTYTQQRYSSFFNTYTAEELWKGVLAETGKASKKGRGKRARKGRKKNLNLGQQLGEGKLSMAWPGLNVPVIKGKVVKTIQPKPIDPEREAELQRIRSEWDKRKKRSVPIEERGWTSKSWGGRSYGPPDPVPGCDFEGFDSTVIQVKRVFNMTGTVGRKRSTFVVMVVGNYNGAIGYAVGKSDELTTALRKAKNSSKHFLHYFERYDDHTILHDVESKFKATRVRMKKQAKGYGLKCHRIIKEICRLAGIKDLHARVYGSTNPLNICHAVFQGLSNQETHQQIADRHGLHLVEFREECDNFPRVVASPQTFVRSDIEEMDWDKEMPLEWKEIKPRSDRSARFERDGSLVF
ncbi:small ribosomal subunit protein uS5m-like [Ptychodera flava]|uniref:small ribosomal subunit protein uS5m-like n=1 Tax=Ptychodera flava TaxID=63121 RepID=UPI00396A8A43